MARSPEVPRWVSLRDALTTFARAEHGTQGRRHIGPLHWYVACRLVIEGGFRPEELAPRPPFVVRRKSRKWFLSHDPDAGSHKELTILGGLKTKNVDIVISKDGIGPCIAVSMKGTLNAFRNLTNRMEEAAGDCTNIHIAYPALVYAFWYVMRANHAGLIPPGAEHILNPKRDSIDGHVLPADVAIAKEGRPTNAIKRYRFAMEGLSGRSSIREEPSRYEAVGLTLVNVEPANFGKVFTSYPEADSSLTLDSMFARIYQQYDMRFLYQAPVLESRTRRLEWASDSPALQDRSLFEYHPRVVD